MRRVVFGLKTGQNDPFSGVGRGCDFGEAYFFLPTFILHLSSAATRIGYSLTSCSALSRACRPRSRRTREVEEAGRSGVALLWLLPGDQEAAGGSRQIDLDAGQMVARLFDAADMPVRSWARLSQIAGRVKNLKRVTTDSKSTSGEWRRVFGHYQGDRKASK